MNPATTLRAEFEVAEQHRTWLWRCAYWTSQVASPPVLGVAVFLLAAYLLATPAAWLWAIGYLALAVGAPCLYIGWLVWRGKLADFHLPLRSQRIRPLLCSVLCTAGAWLVLRAATAPPLLQLLATASTLQTLLFLVITLQWKISLHSAVAANLALAALILLGGGGAPLVALVPFVAWARVHLGRHTVAQTAAGALLGLVVLTCAFYWVELPVS
jgi:hypothetical protein